MNCMFLLSHVTLANRADDIRCKFVKKCMIKRPSVQQYCDLMGTQQKSRLIKIAKFAKFVMSKI